MKKYEIEMDLSLSLSPSFFLSVLLFDPLEARARAPRLSHVIKARDTMRRKNEHTRTEESIRDPRESKIRGVETKKLARLKNIKFN